ncbi:MAG: cytochrome c [Acidobacteriota bacterium]|nr:cytochrome c [Acidobacteriota bacterium]
MRNRHVAALALATGAVFTGCRQDMHNQPRYKPLAESTFFNDHRASRPKVDGTVARGHLRVDTALYTGKQGDQDIDFFPFPITREDLTRGQQRYNIYCSPCHSRVGDGGGLVVLRGFRQPPSYYTDKLKQAPVGHFFDVMTNGFGAMPSYASRVTPEDRWRIIAYIRALQLSEDAKLGDLTAEERAKLATEPPPRGVLPGAPQQITNGPPPNPAKPLKTPVPQEAK